MRTIREVLRLKFDPTEFGDDHVRQGDQFGPWKLSRIKIDGDRTQPRGAPDPADGRPLAQRDFGGIDAVPMASCWCDVAFRPPSDRHDAYLLHPAGVTRHVGHHVSHHLARPPCGDMAFPLYA